MKISVIIPIYNTEKYLKQTLDSIRFQTYKDLEIICILDCPTDNSAEIVYETARDDHRIKFIRNSKNMRQAVSRNTGVENATGEYIHFMDSDDLLNPCFYEAMLNAALNADADVAACSIFYERKPKQSIFFSKNEVLLGPDKIKISEVTNYGWAWRYLIRKSFWNHHNLSFPDLLWLEDMPVMIPMVHYANKIAACPDAVYFYKNRENSVSTKEEHDVEYKKLLNSDWRKAYNICQDFMRTNKIKRHGKSRQRRNGRLICLNDPVEYGKTGKKISVIIPIYNAGKYLKQTLDSIRFQTYKNLEIVCVLDSPKDNSAEIVENTVREDSRVKPIYNQQNMGLPAARNIGVENSSGEYIHFIDADDLLNPDFYDVLMSAAVKDDADVAACSVFYEKKPWRSIWFRKSEVLSGSAKIEKTEVAFMGWAWRYLIRKSFWVSNNLSFPNLVPMEDKPAMIPMIYHANKVAFCPGAVYFYKYRESSILNKNSDKERKKRHHDNRQKARKIFREFMRDNNIKRPSRLLYSLKKKFL